MPEVFSQAWFLPGHWHLVQEIDECVSAVLRCYSEVLLSGDEPRMIFLHFI